MANEPAVKHDADVIIIGSGFGGSCAALRFAEAGEKVLVLERGGWITREHFEADFDMFWDPERNAYGPHDFRFPGTNLFAWLGSGVGGGSNLFAATLKRRIDFEGFPPNITSEEMERYYAMAEDVMGATKYPDYPPYSDVRGTQLLYQAGAKLAAEHPELVEDYGPLNLAMSFAPPDGKPGAPFVNKHGAKQRYSDPREQSILGGDIDSKNTLDRNYLFLAQKHGAEIKAFHEVTRIEPVEGGGYRVHYRVYAKERGFWQKLRRRWLPKSMLPKHFREGTYTAKRLVLSAGTLGSTELLLRARDIDRTLKLPDTVGRRYLTNGDYITLMIAFRGLFISWPGFILAVIALALGKPLWAIPGLILYYAGLLFSGKAYDPDIGATNSDHIRFRSRHGKPQGVYIEGGRYPTPGKWGIAALMSVLGVYRPRRYAAITRYVNWLRTLVPPFGAIARTWPLPLLTLGQDEAYGAVALKPDGKADISFDAKANLEYYRYADRLGRLVGKAAGAWWIPNILLKLSGRYQVPHNLGGCPMGTNPSEGVVDHAGRVFGHKNLMVLDGSIFPEAARPNPALTILAISERAMAYVIAQVKATGEISPEPVDAAKPAAPAVERAAS